MRRFEFQEGSSSKFWEIELSGSSFSVRWGKLGTAGQTQQKDFASEQKAQAEHDKLIKEKTAKGYAEVDSGGAALTVAAVVSAPVAAVAAPVVVTAPAVAVPVAAVVPAPVAAVVPAPVAVTGGAGGEIRWTADMIRLIHPWRRLHYAPEPIKAAESAQEIGKVWELITAQFKAQIGRPEDEEIAALYDAAIQRLPSTHLNVKIGQPVADAGVEAVLFNLLCMSQFGQAGCTDHLVDLWVAAKGLAFAAEALLRSLQYGFDGDYDKPKIMVYGAGSSYRYGFESGVLIPWLRLRELLCAAPAAEWDAALAAGRATAAAVSERSEELGKLLNGGLAYLFPDSGIADDDAVAKTSYAWVVSCTKPEIWRRIFSGAWNVAFQARRMAWRSESSQREGALSMLACLGAGALEGLCSMMDVTYGRGTAEAGAEACGHIPTRAAVQALVQRIHKKEVVPEAQAAVLRWPHFAADLLAQLALNRSSRSATAETMLSQALRRDDGRLIALLPTLPPAQQQLIRAIIQRITPTPDAAPEELHRVFVRPPWLEPKRASKLKILTLNRLPCAPSLEWKEQEQDKWRGYLAESAPDMSPENIAQRLQSMYLPLSAARLADGEDAAAMQDLKASLGSNSWRSSWYVPYMPPRLALILWNGIPAQSFHSYGVQVEQQMLAVHGLAALPGLLARIGRSPAVLEVLMPVRHPDAALEIASAFAWRRKARAEALAWLRAHPEMAVLALIPPAVGKMGKDRDAAGITLRQLVRMGHEALIREVAAQYEAQPGGAGSIDAVHEVLNTDPLDTVPTKIPKMPEFWSAAGLARPRLKGSDRSLPLSAVEALGVMLAFSSLEEPYGGIAALKEMCTAESVGDFAWDLLQAWLLAGAPSKEGWAFRAAGLLGNDEVARKLAPMIRAWPGEAQHQRAVTGLDVLAGIGTDVALMHLNGIAQKVKFKGLQEAAREKITQVAETRGLTQEELADRLVPDLGLDEQGSMVLDFGPRQFTVRFDELLRPSIIAADGKQLPDLPKPVRTDDAEKAKEAQETWKALKKDGKALASQQLIRLESAMCLQRRWEPSVFRTFLVEHPLLLHIVRRLVWGRYDGEGRLLACFRVAEDGSFSDGDDNPFELPEGEDVRVGVAHALEIPEAVAAQFGQLFADYEILQPFSQLGRSCYALTPEERDANSLTRWKGVKVPTGKVLGLANRGWQRGQPQDAGVVCWMERPTTVPDRDIHLHLDPGIWTGMVAENPEQTLETVTISKRNSWYTQDGEKFSALDAITASEIIRAIEELKT